MKSPNFFSETGLNRMAERRIDSVWLEEVAGHKDAVVLPVWRTHNLVDDLIEKPKAVGQPLSASLSGRLPGYACARRGGLRRPYVLPLLRAKPNRCDVPPYDLSRFR